MQWNLWILYLQRKDKKYNYLITYALWSWSHTLSLKQASARPGLAQFQKCTLLTTAIWQKFLILHLYLFPFPVIFTQIQVKFKKFCQIAVVSRVPGTGYPFKIAPTLSVRHLSPLSLLLHWFPRPTPKRVIINSQYICRGSRSKSSKKPLAEIGKPVWLYIYYFGLVAAQLSNFHLRKTKWSDPKYEFWGWLLCVFMKLNYVDCSNLPNRQSFNSRVKFLY